MELMNHVLDSIPSAEFLHDFLQSIAIPCAEGLLQINEGSSNVGVHLLARHLQEANSHGVAGGVMAKSKGTTASHEECVFKMTIEMVKEQE
ncbi:unnamed protein product [Schistocephalus solidus]|uniref:ARM repeat superfamily protein n=1 Tax=Schistocephalus solidus TaxID=70667 RepID=A0A183SEQ8_SCHSO|nr:unnamed protein product [Schistocephalus solidus]